MANETVFRRYEHNPVVTPAAVPTANSIFNSAVVPFGSGFAGVFRVDSIRMEAGLHTGFSNDGLKWQLEEHPILFECPDPEGPSRMLRPFPVRPAHHADRWRLLRDMVPLPRWTPGRARPGHRPRPDP